MKINKINSIIIDFDGVLTNNKFILSEDGKEYVTLNRSDGLAISILKKLKFKMAILSTEKNNVVKLRAKKLGIKCYYGQNDKYLKLRDLHKNKIINLKNTIYVGNDLNDIKAMKLCKYSLCPYDSHPAVKKQSSIILKSLGGEGVIREIAEDVFNINLVKYL